MLDKAFQAENRLIIIPVIRIAPMTKSPVVKNLAVTFFAIYYKISLKNLKCNFTNGSL